MDTNPLLDETSLPAFSQIKPEHVLPAVKATLDDHRRPHRCADRRRAAAFIREHDAAAGNDGLRTAAHLVAGESSASRSLTPKRCAPRTRKPSSCSANIRRRCSQNRELFAAQ